MHLGDTTVDRFDHREGNDDYTSRSLYRLMNPEQQGS